MILGSAAGALVATGVSKERIHEMLDMSFKAIEAAPNDPRMQEANRILSDIAQDYA